MPDVTAERRIAPRYPMVLSAEVVELPRGARLSARTSDLSLTGCYIDTLNPIPQGSEIRLRITHHDGVFEAVGRVVYVSYGLGMGMTFTKMTEEQKARLVSWLENREQEFWGGLTVGSRRSTESGPPPFPESGKQKALHTKGAWAAPG